MRGEVCLEVDDKKYRFSNAIGPVGLFNVLVDLTTGAVSNQPLLTQIKLSESDDPLVLGVRQVTLTSFSMDLLSDHIMITAEADYGNAPYPSTTMKSVHLIDSHSAVFAGAQIPTPFEKTASKKVIVSWKISYQPV